MGGLSKHNIWYNSRPGHGLWEFIPRQGPEGLRGSIPRQGPSLSKNGLQVLKPCQGPTWTGEARMLVIPKQLNPPFKLKNRYIRLTSPVSGGH